MPNQRLDGAAIAALMAIFVCAGVCEAAPAEPPQREIKVIARRFEFVPKIITVRKGERVRLAVTSEDVDHGIAIKEFGVDQIVRAKETKVIELSADKIGRFDVTCSVFCGDGHPEMVGELIVTAAETGQASNLKVTFDDTVPGVVIVESAGQRLRIDTSTKSVARLDTVEPPAQQQKGQPGIVETKGRESSRAYEPYEYHIINVPTTKPVRKHSLNVHFTHRFQQPFHPIDETAKDLFGLDSTSVSGLGFTFGITDRLYANVYRSPLCRKGVCKTIEIGLGYHWLDEAGRSPISLSTYASVEGDDNFQKTYTYNIQAMVGRSFTKYVNFFFSPAVHINSNGQGRFNIHPDESTDPRALGLRLGQHTGSFGFGLNGRIRPTVSLLFEYTPRIGFKMGQVIPIVDEDTGELTGFENDSEAAIGFGVEKRIGRHVFSLTFSNTQATTTARYNSSNGALPPSKFAIGFNLYRRLK
jgi:cytochrome c oxidase subunit II